jgi:hypothetical protein
LIHQPGEAVGRGAKGFRDIAAGVWRSRCDMWRHMGRAAAAAAAAAAATAAAGVTGAEP